MKLFCISPLSRAERMRNLGYRVPGKGGIFVRYYHFQLINKSHLNWHTIVLLLIDVCVSSLYRNWHDS